MKQQSGFTLIELIMVIVILGILAATALPKFVDVKADAELAAIKGVAGAVSSAFVINYAGHMVNTSKGVAVSGSSVVSAAVGAVMEGGMPAGYMIADVAGSSVSCGSAVGSAFTITISNSSFVTNKSATATLVCTG